MDNWPPAPASYTAKQAAARKAFEEHPRRDGEKKCAWYRRLAAASGCSANYIALTWQVLDAERIGAEARKKRGETEALEPWRPPVDFGPVSDFRGWSDAFFRFKVVTEAYLQLARQRRERGAEATLLNIRDNIERGLKRAAQGIY